MADDLDDLLDEFESKLLRKPQQKSTAKTNVKDKQITKRLDEDINSILDAPDDKQDWQDRSDNVSHVRCLSSCAKCVPVYLAGSRCEIGVASALTQRACDKLRCTDCDFKCVMYNDYKWRDDIDYLFLRNNVPDFAKLKEKLLVRKGFRAYACQCKWRSVNQVVDIRDDPDIKWVCGKH
ncbi:PREDICTED: protein C8orf37 homolog [Priapulus caudatus]|uniref:Cilia- and flagella-associated protein 418 n=1 Tax=Priapulus caudatus TaxID=37621 RepID=A0ABM1EHV9_PRICU|nr:PREDICTED: protein C8orf37 homolog [Priapulus caudatus]XP_014671780.1 PREDICTED: protein C8orf37 homolog [Priapulus caudatus]